MSKEPGAIQIEIDRPNQVWCADITYIPVQRGFLYLIAIMDWATRHVLSWRLSNTMDARFCIDALNAALADYGNPEISNTDQGSQFTGFDFTGVLKTPACASPWTVVAAAWTTSSSSASGGR